MGRGTREGEGGGRTDADDDNGGTEGGWRVCCIPPPLPRNGHFWHTVFVPPSLIRYCVLLLRQADGWTDRGGGRSLERDDNRDQTDPGKFSNLSDVELNSNHDGGMIAPLFGLI